MKKIIGISIIVITVSAIVYNFYIKKNGADLILAEVVRGNIQQEVSETGQVNRGDRINLSFKSGGTIENIYVVVGEEVETGDILASLVQRWLD